ncbi:MAG: hypothetical protein WDO68_04225 [Gammaproteobacteria bacterium]
MSVPGIHVSLGALSSTPSSNTSTTLSRGQSPLHNLPLVTVVSVRAQARVDNLRNTVVGTLTDLVSGHILGKSAGSKALDIARLLPDTFLTEENVRQFQEAIVQDRRGVERLLHHTDRQCGNVQGRATSRAVLVALVMLRGRDEAWSEKDAVIAMPQGDRVAFLNAMLAQPADAQGTERSDNLGSGTHVPVQTTAHSGGTAPQQVGTAERPITRQLEDVQEVQALVARACAHEPGTHPPLDRFAAVGKHATSADFVLTDSLASCVPVVVFWNGGDGVQKATLFHVNRWNDQTFTDEIQQNCPQIDSIFLVERRMNEGTRDNKENLIDSLLRPFATVGNLPYSHIHHNRDTSACISVIVDVRNFTITSASDEYLNHYPTDSPHPLGVARFKLIDR